MTPFVCVNLHLGKITQDIIRSKTQQVQNMVVFFVYGTLQRGYRNQELNLPERVVEKIVPAILPIDGFLVHFERGFPGLYYHADVGLPVQGKKVSIAGELVYVKEEHVDETVGKCDRLEAYYGENHPDNMYRKERVTAFHAEDQTPVECETYICLLDHAEASVRVPARDGDSVICWRTFMKSHQLQAAADDWATKS